VLAGLVALVTGWARARHNSKERCGWRLWDWSMGTWRIFERAARASRRDLVGIADGDPALEAKYQKKYALPPKLFLRAQ